MPHVQAMMRAIRRKDRVRALVSGNAALAEMNGIGHAPAWDTAKQPSTTVLQTNILV
jgi:hypothetical protein